MAASRTSRQQDEAPGPYGIAIQRVRTGTTLRIAVSGEIDIATAPALREEIEQAKDRDLDIIVLDFHGVTFMDSTGLHAVLEAQEQLNGRLRIMPGPPVSRLIEVTDLRDRLTLISSATAWLSLTHQPLHPPGAARMTYNVERDRPRHKTNDAPMALRRLRTDAARGNNAARQSTRARVALPVLLRSARPTRRSPNTSFREVLVSSLPVPFEVRGERDGRTVRLIPIGELDIATAPILERAFDAAYHDDDTAMIVVDLTELSFMDSSGINLLVQMTAACEDADRLRIVNGTPSVVRVLDVSGVRDRLPIISSDDDPLAPLS